MPTQQPRAINKNNRSSSETVERLRVWHRQEFPSVYAIQSQASSEECSGFIFLFFYFIFQDPFSHKPKKSSWLRLIKRR